MALYVRQNSTLTPVSLAPRLRDTFGACAAPIISAQQHHMQTAVRTTIKKNPLYNCYYTCDVHTSPAELQSAFLARKQCHGAVAGLANLLLVALALSMAW